MRHELDAVVEQALADAGAAHRTGGHAVRVGPHRRGRPPGAASQPTSRSPSTTPPSPPRSRVRRARRSRTTLR